MALAQLTLLAPGLLGGSVAKAVRARQLAGRIVIWARRPEVREALLQQPWCHAVAATPEEAVRNASLVIIAAPVDKIIELTRQIAPHLEPGAIVTDVGSVKTEISRLGHAALGEKKHFVGSHPMAGSEKTGWEHGTEKLFENRTCFVTPLITTAPAAAETVARFWRDLGSKVVTVAPELHDRIVAHISHLPQVLASTLCAFLSTKDHTWRDYSGGGLRDTTRIAGSDPQLWRTILEQNREEVLHALHGFQQELKAFETALNAQNYDAVVQHLANGKAYRDPLRPPT